MPILISGATGFIGQALCNLLAQDRANTVLALTRPTSDASRLDKSIQCVVYDYEIERLIETLRQHEIEGVIHLASLFLAAHQTSDVDRLAEANLHLGMHLAEAATQAKVRWFINTSSFWQHYQNQLYNPSALYAATKQAFETILTFYRETTPLRIVTLEMFDTFGPHDRRPKLFNLLKRAWRSGEALSMSPGQQNMNLVYIEDVVAAYGQLIRLLEQSGVELQDKYCVSAPVTHTLRQVVQIFCEVTGCTLEITWGGRPYRERELMDPRPLYPPVPGWAPRYTLEAGIRKMCMLEGLLQAHDN